MRVHRSFPVRDLPRVELTTSRFTSRAHPRRIAVRLSSSSNVIASLLVIATAALSSVATAAPTFDVVDLSSHPSYDEISMTDSFAGAGTTHDGRVVFAPYKANHVGVFDPKLMGGPVEDQFQLYDTNLALNSQLFYSAISVGDGRVVFPPYHARQIGVFDGRDNSFHTYPSAASTADVEGYKYIGGGVASDNKVVMCPYGQTTTTVRTLDLNTYSVGLIVLQQGDGFVANGWHGGSATLDGRVVCAPFSSDRVLVYNPGDPSGSLTSYAASVKNFVGATTLADGRIFMAPWEATAVGIFNPNTNTFTADSTMLPSNQATNFVGIITAPDGRVLFQEHSGTGNTHLFDPTDDSLISVDTRYPSSATTRSWWGSAIVENLVVFAPRNVAAVGILKGLSCGENEHVVSGACVRCPSGQFNQAGDPTKGADTACDAECTCARLLNKVGLSYVGL
jgi:hypothetical protein